jgi:glutamine synthetase
MNSKSNDKLLLEIESFRKANPKISEFEVFAVDICGHFFGKRYPISKLDSFARDGLAFPMSSFVLGTLGASLQGISYGDDDGDPDAHFYLIPGSLCINHWGNRPRAQMMATSFNGSEPTFFEPRNLLQKVVANFETKKWHPVVAFELEFFLFDNKRAKHGQLKIVSNPKTGRPDIATVLSSARISDFGQVIDDIIETCDQQSVETSAISAEMGPGQFEINFNHHADVLRAADEACLFKRIVVEVAKKHAMQASFMAKPLINHPGNGLHMHISVVDNKGRNIFAAGDKPHARLLHAIGGLLDTMPASMSLWAPNINSYRRYIGGSSCAPISLSWGHENRSVAFRIPLAKDNAWRVENRVPGADANPYLAMAASLAGIWHGIDQKLDPGKPSENSVNIIDDNLPLSLESALGATIGSEALLNILGKEFVELYCQHRRAETVSFDQFISSREYDWYL